MRAYLGHKNAIEHINGGVAVEIEPYGISVFLGGSIHAREYLYSKPKRLKWQRFITNTTEIANWGIRTTEGHK